MRRWVRFESSLNYDYTPQGVALLDANEVVAVESRIVSKGDSSLFGCKIPHSFEVVEVAVGSGATVYLPMALAAVLEKLQLEGLSSK